MKQEEKESGKQTGFWDGLGSQGQMLPFFGPDQGLKRKGFKVKFLTDAPRRETINQFDQTSIDCWFDIIYLEEDGEKTTPKQMTWTINQISLLTELKKQASLANKVFVIKLIPVDKEWKEKHPNYKGKERYVVEHIGEEPGSEGDNGDEVVY